MSGPDIMKRLVLLSLLITGIISEVFAAIWYVDISATGNNTGTNWTNAWRNFTEINGLSPGDIVYISGGSTSKIYNETLSCYDGVTYKVGQDDGYNGTVIIDAQNIRANCIYLDNNVTISGQVGSSQERHIICRNSTEHGIIKRSTSSNIKLLYLEVYNCGDSADMHGIRLSNARGDCEIAYCSVHDNYYDGISIPGSSGYYGANRIHHCDIYNNSDDGIELRGGFDIYNNKVHDNWKRPDISGDPHPDGMQLHGEYIRVYNNEVYNNRVFQIYLNQLRLSSSAGHMMAYNNISYLTDKTNIIYGNGICYKSETNVTATVDSILIFNNTVVDMGTRAIIFDHNGGSQVTNCFIKNNIVVNCRTGSSLSFVIGTNVTSGVEIDYNLVNEGSTGTSFIKWGNTNYSYENFVNSGLGQANGQAGMPSFIGYSPWKTTDLHLAPNDIAAKNNGINLSLYSNTDKDGKSRPRESYWDIGAYQKSISPPTNVRVTK